MLLSQSCPPDSRNVATNRAADVHVQAVFGTAKSHCSCMCSTHKEMLVPANIRCHKGMHAQCPLGCVTQALEPVRGTFDSAAAALSISAPALLEVVDKSLPTAAGLAGAPTRMIVLAVSDAWCHCRAGHDFLHHACMAARWPARHTELMCAAMC